MRVSTHRYLLAGVMTALLCLPGTRAAAEEPVDMKGISIIGSKESPKALFIVPWKDAESPLVPERPLNSLLNDIPEPIDPDVFRRQLQYYDQVHNFTLKAPEKGHDNN
jgi:hypothetical protein